MQYLCRMEFSWPSSTSNIRSHRRRLCLSRHRRPGWHDGTICPKQPTIMPGRTVRMCTEISVKVTIGPEIGKIYKLKWSRTAYWTEIMPKWIA